MDEVISIPNIGIQKVGVNEISIPNVTKTVPVYQPPPVVVNIGVPIVDMPGCVKFHPDAKKNREQPNLKEEDASNVRVLCDADYPTFDAMDYTPEDLNIYVETPPPKVQPPPDPPTPETPDTGNVAEETPCPGPAQLRVGDVTQSGDEKVVGHELQGNICVTLYEPTSAIEKYVPPINQVSTVTALAVVATAGAAATPLLIRIIRPVVKKIITTAQKKLGKKITKPTRQDIITDEYRKKKGLPPIKR
ncbi:hypothetical protein CPMG_00148 [Prochlorococcus phage MED4-213]|uniref:Gp164 n=1 Tax=Prochlorococcus phage MED4-213 TaxID=889956 RepID=M4QDE0_9CAUD|nr:hypothetical protein CPMG_00148 [Prochlorococcus phage MED4-213]AGH26249.1 hypothetical protein CPMG_00148 [Prochlorococcus phage MED4-213]